MKIRCVFCLHEWELKVEKCPDMSECPSCLKFSNHREVFAYKKPKKRIYDMSICWICKKAPGEEGLIPSYSKKTMVHKKCQQPYGSRENYEKAQEQYRLATEDMRNAFRSKRKMSQTSKVKKGEIKQRRKDY